MRSIDHFTPGFTRQNNRIKKRSEDVEHIHIFVGLDASDRCNKKRKGLLDCVALRYFSELPDKNWDCVRGRPVVLRMGDTDHRYWISNSKHLQRFFHKKYGATVVFTKNTDMDRVAHLQPLNGPYLESTTVSFLDSFEEQAYFAVWEVFE